MKWTAVYSKRPTAVYSKRPRLSTQRHQGCLLKSGQQAVQPDAAGGQLEVLCQRVQMIIAHHVPPEQSYTRTLMTEARVLHTLSVSDGVSYMYVSYWTDGHRVSCSLGHWPADSADSHI